jgi:hypothetical protein
MRQTLPDVDCPNSPPPVSRNGPSAWPSASPQTLEQRTNKLVLIAIATGLWANAINTLIRPVHADSNMCLSQIAHDMHALAHGGAGCLNTRICD